MIKPNEDPFALAKTSVHLIDGALVPAISGATFDVKSSDRCRHQPLLAGDAQDVDIARG